MVRFSFRSNNDVDIIESNHETIKPSFSLNKFKKRLVPSLFNRKKEQQSSQDDPANDTNTIMIIDKEDDLTVDKEDDYDELSISTQKITYVIESFEDEIELTISTDEEELNRDDDPLHDTNDSITSGQTDELSALINTPSTESSSSRISCCSKKEKYCVLREAPSASESAYNGPPRYDWIDVETAAAIRAQAAFRRFKTNKELGRQGLMTAGMRKQRRIKQKNTDDDSNSNSSMYWNYLLDSSIFSSSSNENPPQEEIYRKRKQEQEEKEAKLRKFRMKQKLSDVMVEEIEIVEEFNAN